MFRGSHITFSWFACAPPLSWSSWNMERWFLWDRGGEGGGWSGEVGEKPSEQGENQQQTRATLSGGERHTCSPQFITSDSSLKER